MLEIASAQKSDSLTVAIVITPDTLKLIGEIFAEAGRVFEEKLRAEIQIKREEREIFWADAYRKDFIFEQKLGYSGTVDEFLLAKDASIKERIESYLKDWEDSERKSYSGLKVTVVFIDKTTIELSAVEDINRLPNVGSKAIRKISIKTKDYKYNRLSLDIEDSEYRTFGYDIQSDFKNVGHFSAGLDQILGNVRPWYSRLSTLEGTTVSGFFLSLVGVAVLAALFNSWISPPATPQPPNPLSVKTAIFVLGFFLSPFLLSSLWNIVRGIAFPIAIFALNSGRAHQAQSH